MHISPVTIIVMWVPVTAYLLVTAARTAPGPALPF